LYEGNVLKLAVDILGYVTANCADKPHSCVFIKPRILIAGKGVDNHFEFDQFALYLVRTHRAKNYVHFTDIDMHIYMHTLVSNACA
jgi:hypothetical protein